MLGLLRNIYDRIYKAPSFDILPEILGRETRVSRQLKIALERLTVLSSDDSSHGEPALEIGRPLRPMISVFENTPIGIPVNTSASSCIIPESLSLVNLEVNT